MIFESFSKQQISLDFYFLGYKPQADDAFEDKVGSGAKNMDNF